MLEGAQTNEDDNNGTVPAVGEEQRIISRLRELFADLTREVGDDVVGSVLAQLAHDHLHRPSRATNFRAWEEQGLHLTPVHFYSPIPDTRLLPSDLWQRQSALPGIDLGVKGQLHLLREVFPQYRPEYEAIPLEQPPECAHGFFLSNGMFGGTDALAMHCMIRSLKPRLVIEVGSGYSSRLIAEAASHRDGTELICIEPYPDAVLARGFPGLNQLLISPVEEIDLALFSRLSENDVLSIDSSHVVRCGGDVNWLYLEVLPRLNEGVVVHIHDIFLPFAYPQRWVEEELRFWSEQYLLQAFLAFNAEFEVVLSNYYLARNHRDALMATFPTATTLGGGSFWIRRRKPS